MLIARSRERESITEDGVVWWKEYRVIRCPIQHLFRLEFRYLSRVDGKVYARIDGKTALFTDPETTWVLWGTGPTPKVVVEEMLGDSDLFQAESLSDVHKKAVEQARARRQALEERQRLEDNYQRACERLEDWKREQQRVFDKRHGQKTGEALEKARDRTRARLKDEQDRLTADVLAAKTALGG